MKIKYLGPSPSVNVAPYGAHKKNEIKDYPDEFGVDLLKTSKKQIFEAVGGAITETPALEDMTVAELKKLMDKLILPYDTRISKPVLIKMIKANTPTEPDIIEE